MKGLEDAEEEEVGSSAMDWNPRAVRSVRSVTGLVMYESIPTLFFEEYVRWCGKLGHRR